MNWELAIGIAVLYKYVLAATACKMIGATEGSRTRKLTWQFFFTLLMSLAAVAITRQIELNSSTIIIVIIGMFNAFASYCMWRAYDISMTRSATMAYLDDLTAIGLGYLFLDELHILTPALVSGIVVSFVCTTIFARTKSERTARATAVVKWVLGYSLIWGFALFSMRLYSLKNLDVFSFLVPWYIGSLLGAAITRCFMGKKEAGEPLARHQIAKVALLAVIIWFGLVFDYWIRKIVPLTVVQPIQLVSEMLIPAIIGLIFFKEIKMMSKKEIYIIAGGIIGVFLISVGYGY